MKELKFLVDAMCGRLARFLRIFGYDTVYANDLTGYFNIDPVPDDKLLEFAIQEERTIITRDYPFHKIAKNKSIYLEGEGIYNYLNQLKIKLDLNFNFNMENARCSVCNSQLEKIKDKQLIQEEVQTETYKHYDNFYCCKNPTCRKIFWKGTHIEDIITKLNDKLDSD